MNQIPSKYSLLLSGALVLTGFVPSSPDDADVSGLLLLFSMLFGHDVLALAISIAITFLPLGLIILRLWQGPVLRPDWTWWISRLFLLFALPLVLVVSLLSGPGAGYALILGSTLTIAIAASLRLLSVRDLSWGNSRRAVSMLLGAGGIAATGIVQVLVMLVQANLMADGRPWCIGKQHHGGQSLDAADLRVFDLVETRTGFKDSSRWFFHAILRIDTDTGSNWSTWSVARQGFQKLDRPDLFIVPIRNICTAS